MRTWALLCIVPLLPACRAGSPAAPAPVELSGDGAASQWLTFVSGETGAPVPGAKVTLGGVTLVTGPDGQVRLPGGTGGSLSTRASGFLERRTRPRADKLSLWPTASPTGLDEGYTASLVYGCETQGCVGGETMLRVAERRVWVVPAPGFREDAAAVEALERAAERMSAATGGQVVFTVWPSAPAGAASVTVVVDGDDPDVLARDAAAVTKRTLGSHASIVRSVVVVRSLELARRTPLLLHELGHAFGLGHAPRSADLMWSGPELYGHDDFSPRERLAVALMLQRHPGNRFPDADDDLAGSTHRAAESVIACGRP